jgi:L,D-transpeptidase-like protein/putative peptidoglycan binding protein
MVATRQARRQRRRWPWAILAVVALVVAALGAAYFAWPGASIAVGADGLPQVSASRLAGSVVRVSLVDARGKTVPVDLRDGQFTPGTPIPAGTKLVAEAEIRRPSWIGWLRGHTQTVQLELTAPIAKIRSQWLRVPKGGPVTVSFDRPVRKVLAGGHTVRLPHPARTVSLGRLGAAGTVGVRAVAVPWEKLPLPTRVTWFPAGKTPMLLAPKKVGATTPIRLVFSDPIDQVLHGKTPGIDAPGNWNTVDSHTIEFRPRGYGFGLDAKVKLTLPAAVLPVGAPRPVTTLAWRTPPASELRLEQLLAELQYLPVEWTAATADAPRTWAGEMAAASAPPAGSFSWRYPNTPTELTNLWHPGVYSWIVRGAVMQFQDDHHLTVDGFAGHDVWQALIADKLAAKARPGGYSYVFVHSAVPTSLNLWHNGQVILTSPGNTGIPAAPTQLGTFAVFEHIPVGTMSGTNPDGSHYNDPGIKWISYFNHGEAIHAFNRASFGTPQSLGCVELPEAAAAKVWPYTPIGTLVTVEK